MAARLRRLTAGVGFLSLLLGAYVVSWAANTPPPAYRQGADELRKGMFLVASHQLQDPNFSKTVILLIESGDDGAMGVIINRPSELTLTSVLPKNDALAGRGDLLRIGGPVARNRMVLLIRSEEPPDGVRHVFDSVHMSGSETVLTQMVERGDAGGSIVAFAGYAGWAKGQLEAEIARGDWHLAKADEETVFDKKAPVIWPELIRKNDGQWVGRPPLPGLTNPPPQTPIASYRRAHTHVD